MEAGGDQPITMDVSTAGPEEVVSAAVSDSCPRQPHSKVQKVEAKAEEAVEIPAEDSHDVAATNGCNNTANGARPDHVGVLRVKKLSENATLPARGTKGCAGYDLSSAYDCIVPARGKVIAQTDLSIGIPEGTYARIAPRSGLSSKHSIDVGGGVVDFDYRGPVGVILFNHSDVDFQIKAGERIAQLILERIIIPEVVEVEDLDETERGAGGFGSTGLATAS